MSALTEAAVSVMETPGNDVILARLHGRCDPVAAKTLADVLRDRLPAIGSGTLILDLRGVDVFSPVAVGVLLRAQTGLSDRGGRLVLVYGPGAVRAALRRYGLMAQFTAVGRPEDAGWPATAADRGLPAAGLTAHLAARLDPLSSGGHRIVWEVPRLVTSSPAGH